MHKVIICRGLQGSGKTTWAKEWVMEDPRNRVRINKDDIRSMLSDYWDPAKEEFVRCITLAIIKQASLLGYDIVMDNMNLFDNFARDIIANVKFWKGYCTEYEFLVKGFPTPVEECIARDAKRDKPIGEKVIRETYERFKETIDSLCSKEYTVE